LSDPAVSATFHARTDLGRTREHNEDAFLLADLTTGKSSFHSGVVTSPVGPKGVLFLVADGMGGAAAGELASAMAADLIFGHLAGTWSKEEETTPERFMLRLREAVNLANLQIHSYAREHAEVRGMGTTATVAGLLDSTLYLAQVGDSRAYIVRQGKATQITKDQSLTQRLVDAGELTEEEAEASVRRNIILQALGPDPKIRVELTRQPVSRGDILVLCSDGLSSQVKREEIADLVSRQSDLEAVSKELIGLANSRGGPDNITVVLARFEGASMPVPEHQEEPGYQVVPSEDPSGEIAAATAPPRPAPAAPAPPPARTGSPAGMALLVIGVLVVLLAIFLALG
jgi:protein phosphatase